MCYLSINRLAASSELYMTEAGGNSEPGKSLKNFRGFDRKKIKTRHLQALHVLCLTQFPSFECVVVEPCVTPIKADQNLCFSLPEGGRWG